LEEEAAKVYVDVDVELDAVPAASEGAARLVTRAPAAEAEPEPLAPAPERGRAGVDVVATSGFEAKRCRSNMSFQVCSSWKRVYQYRETCEARARVLGSSTCGWSARYSRDGGKGRKLKRGGI